MIITKITAADIDDWTAREPRRAQELLPQLVWKLILASNIQLDNHHFPFEKAVQYSGYDGYLMSNGSTNFIPDARSVWEFGTNDDALSKFNDDYSKRTADSLGFPKTETTFCFVSSRMWKHRKCIAEVSEEKETEKAWKSVRIYDAQTMELWLDSSPTVSAWFSSVIGRNIEGVCSLEEFWSQYANSTKPPLNSDFFTLGRDSLLSDIQAVINGKQTETVLTGESPLEAVLTLIACILQNPDQMPEFFAKSLLVTDVNRLNDSELLEKDIIIIPFLSNSEHIPVLIPHKATVIVPVSESDPLDAICKDKNRICIQKRGRKSFGSAVEKLGFDSEQAYQFSADVWFNFSALYRKLAKNPTAQLPPWSKEDDIAFWIPAMLLKEWEDDFSGDRQALEMLSGLNYDVYKSELLKRISRPSSPATHINNIFACISVSEMWAILRCYITPEQIQNYYNLFQAALTEIDPAYELPEEKWHFASVLGKKPQYSHRLKKGVLFSLERVIQISQRESQLLVSKIFHQLDSAEKWRTIAPFLPEFTEAVPEEVMTLFEFETEKADPIFLSLFRKPKDPLFARWFHPYIVWALEKLLWNRKYVLRSLKVLCQLSEYIIPQEIGNSPTESVISYFRFWMPQGYGSMNERKQFLNFVLHHYPKTSRVLTAKLINFQNDLACPISKPAGLIQEEQTITYDDVNQMVEYLVKEYLQVVQPCYLDWEIIISNMDYFWQIDNSILEKCSNHCVQMPEEDIINLCSKIAHHISRHRKYAHSNWSESPELLSELESLYNMILPQCPIAFVHNFSYNFDGLNPNPYKEHSCNP